MKADVTAENRPAYSLRKRHEWHDIGGSREQGKTDENQGGVQISAAFLDEVAVVSVSFTLKLVVEFNTGAICMVRKVSLQCLEYRIFQTGEVSEGFETKS